jgi:adenylate cyclase
VAVHFGNTLYRDGDYFGRNVNLAARVVARAQAGEVLVTDPVVGAVDSRTDLVFEPIGDVQLKGFGEPTALYSARAPA